MQADALTLSPACEVRFATPKDLASTGLAWRACAGSAPGCQELQTTESAPAQITAPTVWATATTTTQGIVMLARVAPLADNRTRVVLTPLDGPPRLSMELSSSLRCSLHNVAIGPDGAALDILPTRQGDPAQRWFVSGPLRQDPAWHRVSAALPPGSGEVLFNYPLAVSGGAIHGVDHRQRIWRSQPGSATFRSWRVGSAMPASLCCTAAYGARTYFIAETIPETLAVQEGDARPRVLLRPRSGSGLSSFSIDGDHAWWLQGVGRDRNNIYRAMEIWTSRLTPQDTTLQPRRVRAIAATTRHGLVAGDGRLAWFEPTADARRQGVIVLDPASQRAVRFTPAPTELPIRILAVDRRSLLLEIGSSDPDQRPARSVVRRLLLDSLPTAQLPPG